MSLNASKIQKAPAGSLLAQMDVDLRVSDKSDVCVLYDRDFPFAVRNVEYHAESGELVFNGEHDEASPFGMPASAEMREPLAAANQVHLLRVQMKPRQEIKDHKVIPLVQRN